MVLHHTDSSCIPTITSITNCCHNVKEKVAFFKKRKEKEEENK